MGAAVIYALGSKAAGPWSRPVRLLAGAAGSALAVWGFSRPDALAVAGALVGAGLATRAATNKEITGALGLRRNKTPRP